MEVSELKAKILALLREDLEFRYAVAGLIGLEEILRRLDKHEAEIVKLREDMVAGFRRHDEEIAKLREDMIAGFRRHDELLEKHAQEIARLREDMLLGFRRFEEALDLLRRHIDALGARWGILSEKAFREGFRGLVERELGLKVGKWVRWDGEGYVFGHPSIVDADVSVSDEKVVLVEVKSHVRRADVYVFKRKAEFYERVEGRKPSRLIIVTPYADEDALETARHLQIEVYTEV